jgi:hypothetical protein
MVMLSIIFFNLIKTADDAVDFQHGTMRAYMQGRAEGYLEGMLSCDVKDNKVLDSVRMTLDGESITIPIHDPCFKVFYHIGR